MAEHYAYIALGLLLLYLGAEGLVRGSVALALRMGISQLVIGLTVVAFGTGSPELFAAVTAAGSGQGELALGNIIGSNICNVALILSVAALIRPLRVRMRVVRFDIPVMVVCSVLFCLFLVDGNISRVEGLALALGFVAYILSQFHLARAGGTRTDILPEPKPAVPLERAPVAVCLFLVLGGLFLLTLGAKCLVGGALVVARHFGVSEAVIGLTLMAVGTSLPELAAAAVATVQGKGDIVIGNIVGSNVFNILCAAGLAAFATPIETAGIGILNLVVLVLTALLAFRLMRTQFRLARWEGGVLLAAYVVYLAYLATTA